MGVVVAIVAIYFGCLLGFFWLDSSPDTLGSRDLTASNETLVVLELVALHPTENQLDLNVIVLPEANLLDSEFGVLTSNISVRLYPATDLVELQYKAGNTPARTSTSLSAEGDAGLWPFDTYTTSGIRADVIAGTGDERRYVPARVQLSGSLYGWRIDNEDIGSDIRRSDDDDITNVVLSRSRGMLALIFGICVVLMPLPVLALYVAINTARGRKKWLPQFGTWFAAMLFAVIPIRSVMSPPPGSWIDKAIVFWVLLLLVGAMAIYIVTWARREE